LPSSRSLRIRSSAAAALEVSNAGIKSRPRALSLEFSGSRERARGRRRRRRRFVPRSNEATTMREEQGRCVFLRAKQSERANDRQLVNQWSKKKTKRDSY
jgi:hypothetical protein